MSDVDILTECGIDSEGGKCEECGRGGRGVCQVLIY